MDNLQLKAYQPIIFTIMKNPKCPTCRTPTELVLCYCSEPQPAYFCQNCKQHYPSLIKNYAPN